MSALDKCQPNNVDDAAAILPLEIPEQGICDRNDDIYVPDEALTYCPHSVADRLRRHGVTPQMITDYFTKEHDYHPDECFGGLSDDDVFNEILQYANNTYQLSPQKAYQQAFDDECKLFGIGIEGSDSDGDSCGSPMDTDSKQGDIEVGGNNIPMEVEMGCEPDVAMECDPVVGLSTHFSDPLAGALTAAKKEEESPKQDNPLFRDTSKVRLLLKAEAALLATSDKGAGFNDEDLYPLGRLLAEARGINGKELDGSTKQHDMDVDFGIGEGLDTAARDADVKEGLDTAREDAKEGLGAAARDADMEGLDMAVRDADVKEGAPSVGKGKYYVFLYQM